MQESRPFLVHGQWKSGDLLAPFVDPFTGKLVAHVTQATESDVEEAITSTCVQLRRWSNFRAHARYNILQQVAALLYRRRDEFVQPFPRRRVNRSPIEAGSQSGTFKPLRWLPKKHDEFPEKLSRSIGLQASIPILACFAVSRSVRSRHYSLQLPAESRGTQGRACAGFRQPDSDQAGSADPVDRSPPRRDCHGGGSASRRAQCGAVRQSPR